MIRFNKNKLGFFLVFLGNSGFAQNCAPTFGGSTFGSSQFGNGNLNCIAVLLPPGVPTITEVRYNSNALTVYVTPGVGGSVTSFTANCISTNNVSNLTSSSNTSPIVVSPLTLGLTYRCTVTATNSVGTSAQSTPSELVLATPNSIPTLSEYALGFMVFLLIMTASRKIKNIYS